MSAEVTRSKFAIDNKLIPDWPALYHSDRGSDGDPGAASYGASEGNDELLIFRSASEFEAALREPDHDIQAYCLTDPDNNGLLIDVRGSVFKWAVTTSGASYRATGKQLPLPDIVDLVRRHAALQGHCCVAKIGAGSITQAIALVGHLNQ